MTHITTCTRCGKAYEEASEETANAPAWCSDRLCWKCKKAADGASPAVLALTDPMIADRRQRLAEAEAAAKTRVYKAAVDHIADTMAAGAWQDGPAPKDGSWILGLFYGLPYVVCYDSWEISEEGGPKETEEGWCLAGQDIPMDQNEPEKWARIIHPNQHMPASWDGPPEEIR